MDNKYRTFYKRLLEKENPNPTVLRQTLIKRIMTSMEFKEKIDSQKNSLYQLFKNGNMGKLVAGVGGANHSFRQPHNDQ